MRKCARCRKEANGEEHHLVPKFFFKLYALEENPDNYRVPMCKDCHDQVTAVFEKIRWESITSLDMDDVDTLIEEHYGTETMKMIWGMNKKAPEWILKMMKHGAREGERHKTRYIIMISMHKRNFSDEEIEAAVLRFNGNCKPPEQDSVVKYHIKNTLRRFKGERDI